MHTSKFIGVISFTLLAILGCGGEQPDSTASISQDFTSYGTKPNGCEAHAGETLRILVDGNMTTIFQSGLHEFLADFIARNNRLGSEISAAYHFAD